MIELRDAESNQVIGSLTDAQLAFLIDQLEEESAEDQDYYLNRETLDLLAEAGGDDALLAMLRQAMGEREEMEIRWTRA